MRVVCKSSIVLMVFCICITFCFGGCVNYDTGSTSQNRNTVTSADVLDDLLSQTEQAEIRNFINSVQPEFDNSISGLLYNMHKEEADKLATVGIKGIPIIMLELDDLEKGVEYKRYNQLFLSEVAFAILRTERRVVAGIAKNIERQIFYSGYERACIYEFYCKTKKQVPTIISSDENISLKFENLLDYGMFALPYVVEEIKKGHTEYEGFFTMIGLHLNVSEYMEYMSEYNLPLKERIETQGFMDGSENFDYKVWLSENEEDLNNLFKFLDAYCAEYEAEQNSK